MRGFITSLTNRQWTVLLRVRVNDPIFQGRQQWWSPFLAYYEEQDKTVNLLRWLAIHLEIWQIFIRLFNIGLPAARGYLPTPGRRVSGNVANISLVCTAVGYSVTSSRLLHHLKETTVVGQEPTCTWRPKDPKAMHPTIRHQRRHSLTSLIIIEFTIKTLSQGQNSALRMFMVGSWPRGICIFVRLPQNSQFVNCCTVITMFFTPRYYVEI